MPTVSSSTQLHPATHTGLRSETHQLLHHLGVPEAAYCGGNLPAHSPITGEQLALVPVISASETHAAIARSHHAFLHWRSVPMPVRGELVRLLAEELRASLDPLGRLVTIEAGKILSEGRGEVQEMIDICTFAAGLSRSIAGLTIPSERPHHRLMEQWHPLGPVGIISAFNFPVAVWSWNAALALVCGNSVLWKPSEKTPLTALATQALFERAAARFSADHPDTLPPNLSTLLLGDQTTGELLVDSPLVPLVSATGSTRMGRSVAPRLAARFARQLLELGGNNAAIVCPSADLSLTLRAVAFAAMGTAGQRCTTLRRLIVHAGIYDTLLPRLRNVYETVVVGDPRDPATLVGPLIDRFAFGAMQSALAEARSQGAQVTGGERLPDVVILRESAPNRVILGECAAEVEGPAVDPAHQPTRPESFYVRPALVELRAPTDLLRRETFAPILYVIPYTTLDEALRHHNEVPQGLSSSIFTNDLREAERFLSVTGSDCGIANVNLGPSGAEIGGAFGGEKETGGGRESGSDAWKNYMRRSTNTINFGSTLPLAQGVVFDVD